MAIGSLYRNALKAGSTLHEYRIEDVLGAGGFGITYLALDANLDKPVAIKEYLPGELAMRAPDGNVVAQATAHEAGYKWGLERFLLEARTLAKFSHPHIVRVLRYFEANSTAYMVMEYEKGDSFKTVLQLDPQPSEAALKSLLAPLLEGLAAVHATGFLHRDIKPDNIFVRADRSPVLIDFGAARQAIGGQTRSLTAILTPGYAPLEQYSGDGKQGPWTDLYAMGSVLYRAVVDKNPPDAVSRMRDDSLPTGVGAGLAGVRGKYSEGFLRAIEWALSLDEKARPQSVGEWKQALFGPKAVAPPAQVPLAAAPKPAAGVAPRSRPRRWPYIAAVALLALVAAVAWLRNSANRQEAARLEASKTATAAPTPAAPPAGNVAGAQPGERIQRLRAETEEEFRSADANGDGYLSREEAQSRFPALAQRFALVDADGDGRISMREFIQARRAMMERKSAKQGGG